MLAKFRHRLVGVLALFVKDVPKNFQNSSIHKTEKKHSFSVSWFIYLFTYLFNEAVVVSDYIQSNVRMISQ